MKSRVSPIIALARSLILTLAVRLLALASRLLSLVIPDCIEENFPSGLCIIVSDPALKRVGNFQDQSVAFLSMLDSNEEATVFVNLPVHARLEVSKPRIACHDHVDLSVLDRLNPALPPDIVRSFDWFVKEVQWRCAEPR